MKRYDLNKRAKSLMSDTKAEAGYMSTAVKILICILIGIVVLVSIGLLYTYIIGPRLEGKWNEWMDFAGNILAKEGLG